MANTYWNFYEKIRSRKGLKSSLLDEVDNFCLALEQMEVPQMEVPLKSEIVMVLLLDIQQRVHNYFLLNKLDLRHIPTTKP